MIIYNNYDLYLSMCILILTTLCTVVAYYAHAYFIIDDILYCITITIVLYDIL